MYFLHGSAVLTERAFIAHDGRALRVTEEANELENQNGGRGTNEAGATLMTTVVITCNRYNLARRANAFKESA